MILIKIKTNKGCVAAINELKPLPTYCKAQTKTLFPYTKKKKDTIAVFISCFLVSDNFILKRAATAIMITPAVKKRMEAKKKGGNAVTATLLKR